MLLLHILSIPSSKLIQKNQTYSLHLILKVILVPSRKKGEILSHLREKRYFSEPCQRKECKIASEKSEKRVMFYPMRMNMVYILTFG